MAEHTAVLHLEEPVSCLLDPVLVSLGGLLICGLGVGGLVGISIEGILVSRFVCIRVSFVDL